MDLIKTIFLSTGQSAPYTGEWQDVALGRNMLLSAYTNGTGNVNLEYKNPFGFSSHVTFYSFSGMTSGYSTPAFTNSPLAEIRAKIQGSGNFWIAATIQN